MIEGLRADLDALRADFEAQLSAARGADNDEEVQRLRSSFLGPKGRLTLLLRGLGQLPPDDRPKPPVSAAPALRPVPPGKIQRPARPLAPSAPAATRAARCTRPTAWCGSW